MVRAHARPSALPTPLVTEAGSRDSGDRDLLSLSVVITDQALSHSSRVYDINSSSRQSGDLADWEWWRLRVEVVGIRESCTARSIPSQYCTLLYSTPTH